jgi:outer membrane protein OmpA-like peptidoglycan-associated protein
MFTRKFGAHLLATVLPALLLLKSTFADAPHNESLVRIPFVVGLSTVRAVTTPEGDYETLRVVEAIDAKGYRLVASGEVPSDSGRGLIELAIVRAVRAEDQLAARKMRTYFHTGDAQTFPGTVPGVSAAVVKELRQTNKSQITFLDVGALFGMAAIRRELSGTLTKVAEGPTSAPMLVNGRHVQLPVIHARGALTDGADSEEFDLYVLDDADNPIVLRFKGNGAVSSVIRIEYPEPSGSPVSIESTLAARETAEIYGIYFAFGRADIRKHSERVLQEIAAILKRHPDWKLRIDGHTDGIGNDAANLELSKRRAGAVKAALMDRYGIAAVRLSSDGHGEAAPKDTNDTPEGRARNRRVELRRE